MAEQLHTIDPAVDILRPRPGPLEVFVRPSHVALLGATETDGSVGRTLLENLIGNSFGGQVWPVNPRRDQVLGLHCYKSLADIPAHADLAVIAIPACNVPDAIGDCVAAGVRGAIIISAGFKEIGEKGAALESQIRAQLTGKSLRVIGPNCLGVMSPTTGLNATFASAMVRPGHVAFLSQSGALLTAILDWSLEENVGFSHVLSIGSMLDVGWGDLISFLGDDPQTTSIVIYMESIGNARAFLSAAREVSLQKPIIVIKAGRSEKAAKAAASHTGALTGNDDVLDAAFRRAGVVRVRHISELFNLAHVLAKQPRPKGPKLAIVTNAGGAGVLATDALMEVGGELATLSDVTLGALDDELPAHWSHGNPIDILGDADSKRFSGAVEIVSRAEECDGLLAILTPQAMTDPTATAQDIVRRIPPGDKPILASWMGGKQVADGIQHLNHAGVPTFPYPDSAARTFHYMWQYSDNLRALYETPTLLPSKETYNSPQVADALVQKVLHAERTLLTETESKQLLAAYDIPTVETSVAANADEAMRLARKIGFPVVLKIYSTTITHKTDVGGVQLNLPDEEAVRRAFGEIAAAVKKSAGGEGFSGVTVQPMIRLDGYELIVGSHVDAQFGPVILFGAGGQLVEVLQDHALGLPPLTSTLARQIIERTRIYRALRGIRGRAPVDLAALEQLLVRFSHLVLEQPRIAEVDINPLLAGADGLIALDARVVLHPANLADGNLPRPVIRPYPRQYVQSWTSRDGRPLTIRPIRPEDEPLIAQFHTTLSEQTVYGRYLQVLPLDRRTIHERLSRLCFIDYDRQIALVAIDVQQANPCLAGVARLIKLHDTSAAEFALVVADPYQLAGLGTELMRSLIQFARDENLSRIVGYVGTTNLRMIAICQRLGFRLTGFDHDSVLRAVLDL